MTHIGPFEVAGSPAWFSITLVVCLAFAAGLAIRTIFSKWAPSPNIWFVLLPVAIAVMFFFGIATVRIERHRTPMIEASESFVVAAPTPSEVRMGMAAPTPPLVPASPVSPSAQLSIDDMWKQMTAPRINLEERAGNFVKSSIGPRSPQEITEAARVILSASIPGADPFTQGWLVNAAKAIVRVPVTEQDKAQLHQMTQEVAATIDSTAPAVAPALPPVHPAPTVEAVSVQETHIPLEPSEPKPDWVEHPPKQVGNIQKVVLATDPFSSDDECRHAINDKMESFVRDRAVDLSGASFKNRFGVPDIYELGLNGDYVRRELCTDEFLDTIETSIGPMKKSYVLLEFNAAQDALLAERAKNFARREGLVDTTILASLAMGSIATLFGLLKIDTWTRGYYTKRLFLGVPAAIITVVTLLAWA